MIIWILFYYTKFDVIFQYIAQIFVELIQKQNIFIDVYIVRNCLEFAFNIKAKRISLKIRSKLHLFSYLWIRNDK